MQAEYATAAELTDLLVYIVEDVSLDFGRWGDQYAQGPSLYFVLATGTRFDPYADPLGDNRWPVERARILTDEFGAAVEAARSIAFDRDGAVMLTPDGTFQEQMVRIRGGRADGATVEYPDWMSAKHLSALEVSTRDEVLSAVTLSEEDGRVTVFADGSFDNYTRDELGGPWHVA
ncbi:MAG: hypothetical protein ABEI39_04480 [Halobacteriales archaeon]